MKVAACVLTHNPIKNDRLDLLQQTIESLWAEGVPVYLVDNGSTDGFDATDLGGYRNTGPNTTSGHGTNLCARVLAATDADICVNSDDDILWRPGWRKQLEAWWEAVPDEVILTGCHIEPAYNWNAIRAQVEHAGIKGLYRNSTGAATWTYRRTDIPHIFPIPESMQGMGDVPACEMLGRRGGIIAQVDLADHAGVGQSTWGNRTEELYGVDVDPIKAMVS